jgi:hypothetical protein
LLKAVWSGGQRAMGTTARARAGGCSMRGVSRSEIVGGCSAT